ncbi:MAG: LysR family transcriptional regulator [Pseudomonadota bacterium]
MKPHLSALLPYFLSIAETGSLTRAARERALTQPALSRKMRQLEEGLNVQLFIRHTRGVELTAAGRILLRRARLIEAESRYAIDEIELLKGGATTSVRLTAGPVWCMSVLPQAIAAVKAAYPQFSAEIEMSGGVGQVEAVASGEIDMWAGALDVNLCRQFDLVHVEPLTVDYQIFAPADHPLQCAHFPPARLTEHGWVSYSQDGAWPAMADLVGRLTGRNARLAINSTSLMSAMRIAAHGSYLIGLAHPLRPLAALLNLQPLPHQPLNFSFRSGMCYRPSAVGLPTLSLLIESLGRFAGEVTGARPLSKAAS